MFPPRSFWLDRASLVCGMGAGVCMGEGWPSPIYLLESLKVVGTKEKISRSVGLQRDSHPQHSLSAFQELTRPLRCVPASPR